MFVGSPNSQRYIFVQLNSMSMFDCVDSRWTVVLRFDCIFPLNLFLDIRVISLKLSHTWSNYRKRFLFVLFYFVFVPIQLHVKVISYYRPTYRVYSNDAYSFIIISLYQFWLFDLLLCVWLWGQYSVPSPTVRKITETNNNICTQILILTQFQMINSIIFCDNCKMINLVNWRNKILYTN